MPLRFVNKIVDWLADTFGGLFFILLYNAFTFIWVYLGLFYSHFFDPFPSNFYTLTVSWLAINMTSFVLWRERRNKAREERQNAKEVERAIQDHEMTQAILNLSESTQRILTFLVNLAQENDNDLATIMKLIARERQEPTRAGTSMNTIR